jgi:hypothetical protein
MVDSQQAAQPAGTVVDDGINRYLSRLSQEALLSGTANDRRLSRLSSESLLTDGPNNRRLARLSVEILTPTEPRYRGWGLPR